jgi:hypothetical protein
MGLRRLALAAAVGAQPPALAYALAGAYAERFDAGLALLAVMPALAGACWLVERRRTGGLAARPRG